MFLAFNFETPDFNDLVSQVNLNLPWTDKSADATKYDFHGDNKTISFCNMPL